MNRFQKCFLIPGLFLVAVIAMGATLESISLSRYIAHDSTHYVTTDTSIAMRIQYTGGAIGSATVAVEANGDLTFKNAAGAADTTVSGDGTLAVSGLTFGQVCDIINVSSHWRCILVGVLPSWTADNVLTAFTASATNLTNGAGRSLTYNTADLDLTSISVGPEYTTFDDIGNSFNLSNTGSLANLFNRRSSPSDGSAPKWTNSVEYVLANGTFTSGTTVMSIWAVSSDHAGATETLLWQKVGAATTVNNSLDLTTFIDPATQRPEMIEGPRGARLVVVYQNVTSGAGVNMTAGTIQMHGFSRTD